MGWNSFDCFGSTVTEAEVIANAEVLAHRLAPFGWDHVVVDYCWSHPSPPACTNPNQNHEYQPYLAMDTDFRLLPAPERFPSAAAGSGFLPLSRRIHALGLKFGIHIMRGLPRQAFYPGYPAATLRHRAVDMADPTDTCPWLNHMYGVRAETPAGQDYYNSLFRLYALWEVDFVKADDLTFPYRTEEIEAIDRARRHCGRPITLSLSPGPCPLDRASHVARHAEMWRISADFWDDWIKLREMFKLCAAWAPHRFENAWADADMLPVGRLSKRGPVGPEHDSFFTHEEQKTMLTLWALFRSPLFIGGNLVEMDEATIGLLSHPGMLEVHRHSTGALPLGGGEYPEIWLADSSQPGTAYLGIFNLADQPRHRRVRWLDLELSEPPRQATELWSGTATVPARDGINLDLPPHGAALFRLAIDPSRPKIELNRPKAVHA